MKTERVLDNLINNNNRSKINIVFIYSAVIVLLVFSFYSEKVNNNLSDSMIRLHIVANSNSKADQDIKYLIRDELVNHMRTETEKVKNKEQVKAYVKSHIDELETIANKVIAHSGSTDTAEVSYGKYPFPSKKYSNLILPAGYYDALKIEVGNAEGENWWCVMFPPLCFVEETKGEMDEEYYSILKNELSEDEMDIIMAASGSEELPIEIRFKIVELFQQSKIKLANLFRGIIRLN